MFFRPLAILLFIGLTSVASMTVTAQEDQPLTQKQQDAVKKLVHDYIMENPSIIADAIDALREKEQLAAESNAKKALVDRKNDIFNDPNSPILGNLKGDVTIVEFFDYRCPYCKSMSEYLFDTIKADGKTRLVMKELPVLGADSVLAARAALASRGQKKYEDFHRALMRIKGPINEASIMKAAAEVGLSVDKLRKDMDDEQIDKELKDNIQLSRALALTGTPGFIIGDQIVPGQIPQASLKQLIDQARKPAKN